jgi:Ca-activated chloride channel family protein
MSAPDFDNDAKDAGEIGAGHTVTALYEIVPAKIREQFASTVSSLKYQRTAVPAEPPKELTAAAETGELLTLFLRYKQPDANESTLSEFTVENEQRAFDDASSDFQFAAAVASFGMVLRNSEFRGNSSLADVEQIASSAIGKDPQGHRTEFLDLVRRSSTLQPKGR